MYRVRIQIELEHDFEASSYQEAEEMAENIELPEGYVVDSFEISKIERV